jgi:tetratricopeptide (TPR) repeat protein
MGFPLTTRPEPLATGTLARTPLIHLVLYFLEKKLTGTLEFASPDGRTATLLFEEGRACGALVGDTAPSLGGGMLDVMRHVSRLPVETTYAYYDAFDGLHRSTPDAPPDALGMSSGALDPVAMIWPLLQENPPRSQIDAVLARIGGSSVRLVRGGEVGRLGLGREYSSAVELLAVKPMGLSEFSAISGLGDASARLLIYLLLVTKLVEMASVSSSPRVASSRPVSTPPVASAPPQRRSSRPSMRGGLRRSQPSIASIASMPPDLAPDLAARWKEIVDRARTIDRADYFAMLDLARDATRDEVETTFLALAKQWHPDRLPEELEPVRDACSRVFSRMSEARATLTDSDLRTRYMRLLADGSGSPETQETVAKVVEAATNFQKAEVCFRRNDYVQAEAFCRKAIDADPTQPDYLALLAWLTALKPENQSVDKMRDALQMLDRAIGMSAKCDKAYFWRAQLYKRMGKPDAALRDFRRVIELNPRNIDAARELRLHWMRGGRPSSSDRPSAPPRPGSSTKPPDAAKAGLLGRLFKKT